MKKKILVIFFSITVLAIGKAQEQKKDIAKIDSICTHPIIKDKGGKLLSWYQPDVEGAGYSHVVKIASEFLSSDLLNDPKTGRKLYYLYCEINGPESGKKFYEGTGAPNNPSCVFAGLTESIAVKYRIYSGDESYLKLVRDCLDYMLKYGTSSSDGEWGNSPYSSAPAGDTIYKGSGYSGDGAGDGVFALEPDKVGEMGVAYLQFYQITEEPVYLKAALDCADALAKNVRKGNYDQSPWPFRVHGRSGFVLEEYCSNVLPPVKLFDELMRVKNQIQLDSERIEKYKSARDKAWNWLFSWQGPMRTFVWKGYFEDVPYDHKNENRVQITPVEVARYLIQHPEYDKHYKENITALLQWSNSVFGTQNALGYNAQCEQLKCMTPMGSHTARYASVCAMWYSAQKDEWYKNEAFENFNWATYCISKSGFVSVGPEWMAAWFSDGYGDYIKHFIDGMAAIPEWAPAGEDHLLSSTGIVQKITYEAKKIAYRTFHTESIEVLRLRNMPKYITIDGKEIKRVTSFSEEEGWSWEKLNVGGVLRIKHNYGRNVEILNR